MVATQTATDPRLEKLQNKLNEKIEDSRTRYGGTLDEIASQTAALEDHIVPIGKGGKVRFTSIADHINMHVDGRAMRMTEHSIEQAGAKLGANANLKALCRGAGWQRELAAHILDLTAQNTRTRSRVLVRSVFGEVRGILSDRYRRLDQGKITNQFLQASGELGLELYGAEIDATRTYVETIMPVVFPIKSENHPLGFEAFGARLQGSDYGDGALSLSIFSLRIACMNLMMGGSVIRQVHLGARLLDNVEYSSKTYQLDTQTSASVVRDTISHHFQDGAIQKRVAIIEDAANDRIGFDGTIKKLPRMGVGKGEVDAIVSALAEAGDDLIPEGPLTRYRMSQAVALVANQAKEIRRRRELQELSGKMIGLN